MKSRTFKTITHSDGSPPTVSVAPNDAPLGNFRDASLQVRRVINIPNRVSILTVIQLFERTTDITGLGKECGRLEFDFNELGEGKIISE